METTMENNHQSTKKKVSTRYFIRRRILRILLFVSILSMVIIAVVGYMGMVKIRKDANQGIEYIGESAASESEDVYLAHECDNLLVLSKNKALYAQAKIESFQNYVSTFAAYATGIYSNTEAYQKREVLPPQRENEGIASLQRYLASKEVKLSNVWEEMSLLGNMEYVFAPAMRDNAIFATVYIGTESGFLLSYDDAAQSAFQGNETDQEEFFFPFADSEWYQLAKRSEGPSFTSAYQDGYGRGLMVTCVCPVYDGQKHFMGAVALDILIGDLTLSLIELDGNVDYEVVLEDEMGYVSVGSLLQSGGYDDYDAFLVDENGNVVASSKLVTDGNNMQNICLDSEHPAYSVSKRILLEKMGFTASNDAIYYVYMPISGINWIFVMSVPMHSVTESVYEVQENIGQEAEETAKALDEIVLRTIFIFILIFLVMIALTSVNAWSFAKKLTKPIITLGQDVEQISSGDLDHRSEVKTGDEIEALANSFNNMTESMQNYIKQVTEMTTEHQRLSTELDIATNIQNAMLPHDFTLPPGHNEYDIYASMDPAKEVGGDFYDFFLVDDDHLAMVIADVSGKGVPAALFMVISKTLLHTVLMSAVSPEKVLTKINDRLCEDNDAAMFVTAWIGILELSTGVLTCANAGHEYPVFRKGDGKYEIYRDEHGTPLGWMPGEIYKKYKLLLEPGDCIFLYTDGVPEATDANNQLFGFDRMIEALNEKDTPSCEDKLRVVRQHVDAFVGDAPQFDDLTMLSMHYKGGKPRTQELTVEAVLENLLKVTEFIDEKLEKINCPEKTKMQIDVAIDEMFSNITYYAYSPETGPVTVKVELENDPTTVVISFVDNGIPYDPFAKDDPDVEESLESEGIGGLGIFIVKKTMDEVSYEYRNGQNIVKIKKIIEEVEL